MGLKNSLSLLMLLIALIGCGGSDSSDDSVTQAPRDDGGEKNIISLELSQSDSIIEQNQATSFKVTASLSNGGFLTTVEGVQWFVNDTEEAMSFESDAYYWTPPDVGEFSIYAQLDGIRSNAVKLQVQASATDVILDSIHITLSASSLFVEERIYVTATAHYSDGSEKDVTQLSTWQANNEIIELVEDEKGQFWHSSISAVFSITAELDGIISEAHSVRFENKVLPVTLQSIMIKSRTSKLPLGEAFLLEAIGLYSDGTRANVSSTVQWQQNNMAIPSTEIADNGSWRPISKGIYRVTAVINAIESQEVSLIVGDASLRSVAIVSNIVSLPLGDGVVLQATASYSDQSMADITSQVTWQSNGTAIPAAELTDNRRWVPKDLGDKKITAHINGIDSQIIDIKVKPKELRSLNITLDKNAFPLGDSVALGANGVFSDGTKQSVLERVQWQVNNRPITDGSLRENKIWMPTTTGTVTLRAVLRGIPSRSETVVVNDKALRAIKLSADKTSIPLGKVVQLKAIGAYSDKTEGDITNDVAWSVNQSPAGDSIDQGLWRSATKGKMTFSASLKSIFSPSIDITVGDAVLQSVAVSSDFTAIPLGDSVTLTAIGTYSDDTSKDITETVQWFYTDRYNNVTGLIREDELGENKVWTPSLFGSVEISAQVYPVQSTPVTLNIGESELRHIDIVQKSSSKPLGRRFKLQATGRFSNGEQAAVSSIVQWMVNGQVISSDVLSAKGYWTPKEQGDYRVVAKTDTLSSEEVVYSVTAPIIDDIQLTLENAAIPINAFAPLVVNATYSDGSEQELKDNLTFTATLAGSPLETDHIVFNGNQVSGNTVGDYWLFVTHNGVRTKLFELEVKPKQLQQILLEPFDVIELPLGKTQAIVVTGQFNNQSSDNISAEVTWNLLDHPKVDIVLINGAIEVTAKQVGELDLIFSKDGIHSEPVRLKLKPPVMTELSHQLESNQFAKGRSFTVPVIATYSNGDQRDVSDELTWSISSEAVVVLETNKQFKAIGKGSVDLRARHKALVKPLTFSVEITDPEPLSLAISFSGAASSRLEIDESIHLKASITRTDGDEVITELVQWRNSFAVKISDTGEVTGQSMGEVTIRARYGDLTSNSISLAVVAGDKTPLRDAINRAERLRQQYPAGIDYQRSTAESDGKLYWAIDTAKSRLNSAYSSRAYQGHADTLNQISDAFMDDIIKAGDMQALMDKLSSIQQFVAKTQVGLTLGWHKPDALAEIKAKLAYYQDFGSEKHSEKVIENAIAQLDRDYHTFLNQKFTVHDVKVTFSPESLGMLIGEEKSVKIETNLALGEHTLRCSSCGADAFSFVGTRGEAVFTGKEVSNKTIAFHLDKQSDSMRVFDYAVRTYDSAESSLRCDWEKSDWVLVEDRQINSKVLGDNIKKVCPEAWSTLPENYKVIEPTFKVVSSSENREYPLISSLEYTKDNKHLLQVIHSDYREKYVVLNDRIHGPYTFIFSSCEANMCYASGKRTNATELNEKRYDVYFSTGEQLIDVISPEVTLPKSGHEWVVFYGAEDNRVIKTPSAEFALADFINADLRLKYANGNYIVTIRGDNQVMVNSTIYTLPEGTSFYNSYTSNSQIRVMDDMWWLEYHVEGEGYYLMLNGESYGPYSELKELAIDVRLQQPAEFNPQVGLVYESIEQPNTFHILNGNPLESRLKIVETFSQDKKFQISFSNDRSVWAISWTNEDGVAMSQLSNKQHPVQGYYRFFSDNRHLNVISADGKSMVKFDDGRSFGPFDNIGVVTLFGNDVFHGSTYENNSSRDLLIVNDKVLGTYDFYNHDFQKNGNWILLARNYDGTGHQEIHSSTLDSPLIFNSTNNINARLFVNNDNTQSAIVVERALTGSVVGPTALTVMGSTGHFSDALTLEERIILNTKISTKSLYFSKNGVHWTIAVGDSGVLVDGKKLEPIHLNGAQLMPYKAEEIRGSDNFFALYSSGNQQYLKLPDNALLGPYACFTRLIGPNRAEVCDINSRKDVIKTNESGESWVAKGFKKLAKDRIVISPIINGFELGQFHHAETTFINNQLKLVLYDGKTIALYTLD